MSTTVGAYIAQRLSEIGISDYFAIPGDFNLTLLDEFLKNKSLKMINCCNELNGGYAADGYARIKGVSALVVTFGVGSLSAINAVTGAYAENLPLILISGGPNTNSVQDSEILHHTTATEHNDYVKYMFSKVTAHAVYIHKPIHAAYQIDNAIEIALTQKKPVYIEVACNLSTIEISPPTTRSLYSIKCSNENALKEALADVATQLNNAAKPVFVAGSQIRPWNACEKLQTVAVKSGYAIASMPDAKGFISEALPNFIGIYWGPVSTPGCSEIIESSDIYCFVGANFNDYTTVGYVCNITPHKMIEINEGRITVLGRVYTGISISDFLSGLESLLKFNDTSLKAYKRIAGSIQMYQEPQSLDEQISTRYLFGQIQKILTPKDVLVAETGDSWFNSLKLNLPDKCRFEIQMQYGSIGWASAAVLGMQAALVNSGRVIGITGDGSFQMTAQEISTIIRYKYKPVIFLLNNASYGIEVQIHDGPYNVINNWNYADLIKVFNGDSHGAKAFKVKSCKELLAAIQEIPTIEGLCFIEVILDPDDCNKSLLEWGARVAVYNGRPMRS